MRMLLVHLPHAGRTPLLFPIGIGNIANAVSEIGVEFAVLDIFAHGYSPEEVRKYLCQSKWDLIGISAFSTQYKWAKWMAEVAKQSQPQALVVMGGPLATFNAELVLKKTLTDVCVISEGEETIKDLLQHLGNFAEVKGIYYKTDSGQVVATAPRPYIRDLDSLPPPRYDIFPMEVYFNNLGVTGIPKVKVINTLAGRGCPYSCKFCSRTFSGIRLRSIDKIVEEIGHLRDRYGIRGVAFGDELVLVSKKRAYELCEKIKPLKVYWDCQGRANIVDLDLLRAMKDAGCTSVGFGIESASQKILDSMNKKVTVRQNELAITNALKAGLIPVVQMIYGYPGEDQETIRETVEFFKRVHFYPPLAMGEAHFNLLTPLPGSPLYEELLADGRITDEEEYLLGLEEGYYPNSPLQINLTEFSNDELLANKRRLSQQVKDNYQKYLWNHPWEYIIKQLQKLSTIKNIEGYWGVASRVAQVVKRRARLFFCNYLMRLDS